MGSLIRLLRAGSLGLLVLLWSWLVPATTLAASLGPAPETAPAPVEASADPETNVAAPDSPRVYLRDFLALCEERRFSDAGAMLEVPGGRMAEPAHVAERLCAVLLRRLWIDPAELSGESKGAADDGFSGPIDEIAKIRRLDGSEDSVRLVRRVRPKPHWVFDRTTMLRVEDWYGELDDRWLRENLPQMFFRPGPRGLLLWQWVVLPVLALIAGILGLLLARLSIAILRRAAKKLDTPTLTRTVAPVGLLWAVTLVWLVVPRLKLSPRADEFVQMLAHAVVLGAGFWLVARSLDIAGNLATQSSWGLSHPSSRSLVPLGRRISKILVFALALVAILSELGYPVASLIAGLGIGGLALALAAQKTVENLFGAFSIGADQPFSEGDVVRIEDFVGTVESIGLRSTRIRTAERTVITMPNGKLADMRVESLAARDRMRLHCTLGLVYETSAAQVQEIVEEMRAVLREHPNIWPDTINVHFVAFGDSSLNIEIMAWFDTRDWLEFLGYRQEVLLRFMHVVEQAGSAFAFPTRTVHLVGDTAARARS